jgi:pimeloyl-ACP methyl ester carboxylesterase
VAVAGLLAAGSAPAPGLAAPPAGETPVPALSWHSCYNGFDCATAQVPLDYRRQHGTTISIAVLRHQATDPAHRLGSLFVNGGGPAAQIQPVLASFRAIPADWTARYDIITFDPRGFGSSRAIRCFPSVAAQQDFFAGLPAGVPVTRQQISHYDQTWSRFDARCAHGALIDHDSTADVARDLDLLRQAVKSPALNYVGLSYGTGLGATYANLFPTKVGRMVLDGNLDPVAWTHGDNRLPSNLREGEDQAHAAALSAFLSLCGAKPTTACAFSAGTPGATHAKFDALRKQLHRNPVTIGTPPDAQSCDDICLALTPDLTSVRTWPDGAIQLQQIWAAAITGQAAPAPATEPPPTDSPEPYSGPEQHYAVLCSDSADPHDPNAYTAAARLANRRSGSIGPAFAWAEEPCAHWPTSQDAYRGPWNRPTATTILVVGNTGDPNTPYRGSLAMSHDLAQARLLTVDGYGHTAFSNPSTCATSHETGYLLTGALPPASTTCPADTIPFT